MVNNAYKIGGPKKNLFRHDKLPPRTEQLPLAEQHATAHLNNIFGTLRTVFPVSAAALTAFSHLWSSDPNITPEVWMHAGQEKWIGITGEAPENNTTALELLKGKMMDGVPWSVKQQMLADCTQTEAEDVFTSPVTQNLHFIKSNLAPW